MKSRFRMVSRSAGVFILIHARCPDIYPAWSKLFGPYGSRTAAKDVLGKLREAERRPKEKILEV